MPFGVLAVAGVEFPGQGCPVTNEKTGSRRPFFAMGAVALVIVLGLWFGRNLSAPAEESQNQLEVVKAAVLLFVKTEGGVPPHLDALVSGGYLDSMPVNRSGFPLVLNPLGENEVEIVDIGPDGKEGGFMFNIFTLSECGRNHFLSLFYPLANFGDGMVSVSVRPSVCR